MKYVNTDKKSYKNYEIYCYTYETQYNWGHIVKIYNDDYRCISEHKITYYNRTWERYQYQSCILGAIDNLISSRKDYLIDVYKEQTGKKRASAYDKERAIAGDSLLAKYEEMYKYFDKEYTSWY